MMSPRNSKDKGKKAKPVKAKKARSKTPAADPDVYVGMLFISTASLITGICFLVAELYRYDWVAAASGR